MGRCKCDTGVRGSTRRTWWPPLDGTGIRLHLVGHNPIPSLQHSRPGTVNVAAADARPPPVRGAISGRLAQVADCVHTGATRQYGPRQRRRAMTRGMRITDGLGVRSGLLPLMLLLVGCTKTL